MTRALSLVLVSFMVVPLISSCGGDATLPPEDGGGGGVDGGGPADASAPPPGSTEAAMAIVAGIAASSALAAPLVQDAQELRDSPESLMPGDMRQEQTRMRVEDGVAGNSIVTDPTCVVFDWGAILELRATVTFDACVLEATMQSLTGSMTLAVSFGPTKFAMQFDALDIGGLTFDGTVELIVGGRCGLGDTTCAQCADSDPTCAAMQANQQTVNANLTIGISPSTTFTLEGVTIVTDATGNTVDGSGTVASSAFTGAFTANDVFFATGDCLPTSGSVDLDDGSPAPLLVTTVTFLADTPSTGEVYVQVNGFPPLTAPPPRMAWLTPCL